jgi:hypothetical protein
MITELLRAHSTQKFRGKQNFRDHLSTHGTPLFGERLLTELSDAP